MARIISGTLYLPDGSGLANGTIHFVAKRTEASGVVEGASASFTTDVNGGYSQSIEQGHYAILMELAEIASGVKARRWHLGDVWVETSATPIGIDALLVSGETVIDPGEVAIQEFLADCQAERDAAEAAAAAAAASEDSAAASATAAATSEDNAAASAASAAASEGTAASSAAAAADSDGNAAASATAAGTSETNAAASAASAGASATGADESEAKAQKWAEEAEDVAVEAGAFSSKHHATKAAASASAAATSEGNAASSASAAADSASSAGASASAAAGSESNAAASAFNAAASEGGAATSADEAAASASAAATSETNAADSEATASTAAASAEAAWDSFDDRYLGPKAADPSTDNDGEPLLAGALYFNTTLNEMRVRDSANTSWIPASGNSVNSVDEYADGVDFTGGVTTQFTLSRPPGAEENVLLFFDAAWQPPSSYVVNGTTLTLNEAVPEGVSSVYAVVRSSLVTGTLEAANIIYDDTATGLGGNAQAALTALSTRARRNYLINGCFRVWQRSASQTTSGYGSDDRWSNQHGGSTKTHELVSFAIGQADVPGNPKYFSRTTVTSVAGAGNYVTKAQRIEGVRSLAGRTAVLSFYAKADSAKNMAIELVQRFGTGGTVSADVKEIGSQLIALTTAWQKFEISLQIPSIAGKSIGYNNDDFLQVGFFFDAGSDLASRTANLGQQSGTFDLAQVQIVAGPSATDFEDRDFGLEKLLCQRYYWRGNADGDGYGIAYTSSTANYQVGPSGSFPAQMRATPTMVIVAEPTYVNCTSDDIKANNGGFMHRLSPSTTGGYRAYLGTYEADAEL